VSTLAQIAHTDQPTPDHVPIAVMTVTHVLKTAGMETVMSFAKNVPPDYTWMWTITVLTIVTPPTITTKMGTGHVPLAYTHVKHAQTLLLVPTAQMMPATYMKEPVSPSAQMATLRMTKP
jgi:hypothetical protein